jgi:hypothetical protein
MSRLNTLILFTLIAFCLSTKLKTKTKCVAEGQDCDLTSYCCHNLVCKDYRCAVKGTKDNQMDWAPLGYKCDFFHHCSKHYVCQSHRCVINKKKILKTIKKQVNKAYKTDLTKSLTNEENQ